MGFTGVTIFHPYKLTYKWESGVITPGSWSYFTPINGDCFTLFHSWFCCAHLVALGPDASGPILLEKLLRLHSLVVRQRLDNLAKDDGASRPQKPRGGSFCVWCRYFFLR